jgi:hypothetical protein
MRFPNLQAWKGTHTNRWCGWGATKQSKLDNSNAQDKNGGKELTNECMPMPPCCDVFQNH